MIVEKIDVEYDAVMQCYAMHYRGEIICLSSEDIDDAMLEAQEIASNWQ